MTDRSIAHGTFVLERTYPASPARVFRAWADPSIKKRWFGGGFLREYYSRRDLDFSAVPIHAKHVDPAALNATPEDALSKERKSERRKLVRRQHVTSIAAAWIVTVPASAVLAAGLFWALDLLIG